MPGGVAVFDYNGDGRADIFFTNGAKTPSLEKSSAQYANRLYRNDGEMRFTDVTECGGRAGRRLCDRGGRGRLTTTTATSISSSPASAQNQLLRNRGDGRFEDVTRRAGIASGEFGVAGAWFDYDNDGRLDLFVVNYVQLVAGHESDRAATRRAGFGFIAIPASSRGYRTACIGTAATAHSRMSRRSPVCRRTSARG